MPRVSGFRDVDVDLLTLDLTRIVQGSFERVFNSVSDEVLGLTAAGKEISSADNVAFIWQDELDGVLTPYIADIYTGSSVQVAVGLADAFPSEEMPGVPVLTNNFTMDYVKSAKNRLVGVSDELWQEINAEITLAVQKGWSNQQLAKQIRLLTGFSHARATVIARTETHAANEAGAYDQMKFVGFTNDEVDKVWLSTYDLRTRETHVRANGQRVGLDEMFRVGLAHLRYPGDPGGLPEEIIQCRCSVEYDVDKEPLRCSATESESASATGCVLPVPESDISGLTDAQMALIFKIFKAEKTPPSASGTKILKAISYTRSELKKQLPDLDVDALSNKQLLAVVDKLNTAKVKTTYSEKYGAWEQTTAGKKALDALEKTDNPADVSHVVAPITETPVTAPATPAPVSTPAPVLTPSTTLSTDVDVILTNTDTAKSSTLLLDHLGKYADDDVIAYGKSGAMKFKVVREDKGHVDVYSMSPGATDWVLSVKHSDWIDFDGTFPSVEWHLVPTTPARSAIPGTAAGELIEWKPLFKADVISGQEKILAYAISSAGEHRFVWDGYSFNIESKLFGESSWSEHFTDMEEYDFQASTWLTGLKWHTANYDGSSPASIESLKSGLSVPVPSTVSVTPAPIVTTTPVTAPAPVVSPAPPVISLPKAGASHFGVRDGDKIDEKALVENWARYPDGYIIATGELGGKSQRLVVVSGHLVRQSKTGTSWKNVGLHTDGKGLSGVKWTAHIEKLPKASETAAKKYVLKLVPDSGTTDASLNGPIAVPSADGEIDHISDDDVSAIFAIISNNGFSTWKFAEENWLVIQKSLAALEKKYKKKYGELTDLQYIRVVDKALAKSAGVPDTHNLENKIVSWLQTPQGRQFAARKIDAPLVSKDVPTAYTDFSASEIPFDDQKYEVIRADAATIARSESWERYDDWTDDQRAALRQYTSGDYTYWNEAIRKGDLGHYAKLIRDAQDGMRPSTRPMLLHRGTSFQEFNDPRIADYESLLPYVGKTYINRNFNSTSIGGSAAFSDKSVLLEIEAPIGTPMAYIADISHFPGEAETLLPAHLLYKIISIRKRRSGVTVVRVRVIGAR